MGQFTTPKVPRWSPVMSSNEIQQEPTRVIGGVSTYTDGKVGSNEYLSRFYI